VDLRLASEHYRRAEPEHARGNDARPDGPQKVPAGAVGAHLPGAAPAGRRHAFRLGYERAVCGARLERMITWPALKWPGGPVPVEDLCGVCADRAAQRR
jgi:hypothetical protein